MKIRNLIERLKEFEPEANIYFTLSPDSKEGYPIVEFGELGKYLVMAILKKAEEPQ